MRAILQRVTRASVTVDDQVVGAIGTGLCVLVGVTHSDRVDEAKTLANKIWNLRLFEGDDGRMDLSAADAGHEILVVSQFTLYGDTRKGRRPSWGAAAPPDQAEPLIEALCDELRTLGAQVATGQFQAEMAVELVNHGPVTLLLEADAPSS